MLCPSRQCQRDAPRRLNAPSAHSVPNLPSVRAHTPLPPPGARCCTAAPLLSGAGGKARGRGCGCCHAAPAPPASLLPALRGSRPFTARALPPPRLFSPSFIHLAQFCCLRGAGRGPPCVFFGRRPPGCAAHPCAALPPSPGTTPPPVPLLPWHAPFPPLSTLTAALAHPPMRQQLHPPVHGTATPRLSLLPENNSFRAYDLLSVSDPLAAAAAPCVGSLGTLGPAQRMAGWLVHAHKRGVEALSVCYCMIDNSCGKACLRGW